MLRLSQAELRDKLDLSLDGVVLSMPPADAKDRFNYMWGAEKHTGRKPNETNQPALAGKDEYKKQVPIGRAILAWGGLSHGGFAPVRWHVSHKTNQEDWSKAVRDGFLTDAVRSLKPTKRHGRFG